MKKFKKILAIVLAMAMTLAMATMVSADDTYSITINNSNTGHTYTAYQIFTGDYSDGLLSNVVWGSGVDSSALLTAIADDTALSSLNITANSTAAELAAALSGQSDNSAIAEELAKVVAANVSSGTASSYADSVYTISGLASGYYLVVDSVSDSSSLTGDAVSRYMLYVLGANASISTKAVVPTISKAVGDNSETYNTAAEGDSYKFTLTITTPSDLDDYETYKLVATDTMTNMTLDTSQDVTIKVGNNDSSTVSEGTSGDVYYSYSSGVLTVTITDAKTLNGYTAGNNIVITYYATLSSSATQGNGGNANSVYLNYYDDPESSADPTPTGTTTTSTTNTYTTQVTVKKVDGSGTALSGAGFTLYDSENQPVGSEVTVTQSGEDYVAVFSGLDDGTYTLKETTTPAGYNTASDITFTLTYTEGTGWTVDTASGLETDTTEGTFKVTVMNVKGSALPSTGGMGTTVLYVIGIVLVLGAGVILVSRRRMSR